ncbi:unnamed protein product [Prorocentrum cordatum]|uniref:Uncharacterized protein n=1 Tax=Prorocentrum cordatum TaxID=2364126 RepID=A0ABN9XWS0_9DINO|nr:unnamed protein product [Polarella glacialis]
MRTGPSRRGRVRRKPPRRRCVRSALPRAPRRVSPEPKAEGERCRGSRRRSPRSRAQASRASTSSGPLWSPALAALRCRTSCSTAKRLARSSPALRWRRSTSDSACSTIDIRPSSSRLVGARGRAAGLQRRPPRCAAHPGWRAQAAPPRREASCSAATSSAASAAGRSTSLPAAPRLTMRSAAAFSEAVLRSPSAAASLQSTVTSCSTASADSSAAQPTARCASTARSWAWHSSWDSCTWRHAAPRWPPSSADLFRRPWRSSCALRSCPRTASSSALRVFGSADCRGKPSSSSLASCKPLAVFFQLSPTVGRLPQEPLFLLRGLLRVRRVRVGPQIGRLPHEPFLLVRGLLQARGRRVRLGP